MPSLLGIRGQRLHPLAASLGMAQPGPRRALLDTPQVLG